MPMELFTVQELSKKFGISYIRAWTWTRNLPIVKTVGNVQLFDGTAAEVIRKHLEKQSGTELNRMANSTVINTRG